MSKAMRTTTGPSTSRPAPGRWTTRSTSAGGFPSAPSPSWTPDQLARWEAVRAFAAAHPGNAAGGWTHENAGIRPGAVRMLACWAAAPVAGGATLYTALHAGVPQAPAAYTAAGVGAWLIATGARIALRADAQAEARMRAESQAAATQAGADVEAPAVDGQLGGLAQVIPLHAGRDQDARQDRPEDGPETLLVAASTPPLARPRSRGGWRR